MRTERSTADLLEIVHDLGRVAETVQAVVDGLTEVGINEINIHAEAVRNRYIPELRRWAGRLTGEAEIAKLNRVAHDSNSKPRRRSKKENQ